MLWDERMREPWVDEFYGGSGYFNFGIGQRDLPQADACAALVDRLIEMSGVPARARTQVLDVACGNGASTARLAARMPDAIVVAINTSIEQLRRAALRAPSAGRAGMDAASLGVQSASVDLVISVEAAFSFHTREAFFREARRVLRPGGRVALSDILLTRLGTAHAPEVDRANFVASPHDYRDALSRAGFIDVELADVLPDAWGAFRARKRAFHDGLLADGRFDAAAHKKANARLEIWNTHIRHYLLAAATAA